MPIRMTTHDEIVCEVDEARAEEAKAILRREMLTLPDWAAGLPLQSEESVCLYTKSKAALQGASHDRRATTQSSLQRLRRRHDAIDATGAWQYHVVTDDVWLAAGMPHASERSPGGDFLCSLPRSQARPQLTPRDFSDVPINAAVTLALAPATNAPLLASCAPIRNAPRLPLRERRAFLIAPSAPARALPRSRRSPS